MMAATRTSSVLNPFALQGRISRGVYAGVGLGLMATKYLVELAVIGAATGQVYRLMDFFSPLLASREKYVDAHTPWLPMAWLMWTVPFVWIAIAMTFRRAADAGVTRWFALAMLVPLLNFAVMLGMTLLPRREDYEDTAEGDNPLSAAYQSPASPSGQGEVAHVVQQHSGLRAALLGLAVGVTYTLVIMVFSVYGLGSYGAALFYGAPVVTGAAAAYVYNRPFRRRFTRTLTLACVVAVCCSAAFLLLGLEGLICVVMALPILAPMMMLGAALGWLLARGAPRQQRRDDSGMVGALIILPVLAGVESAALRPAERLLASEVIIAAPPDKVWDAVVEFPQIDAPPDWFFRLGIAMPQRARIVGHGVGAVRYCEFTTGAFVEPITAWAPGERLAFDVVDQPEPMYELTPYRHLHPPHLTGAFRSTRGEFQLIALPGGRTRLVGRTWYTLDLAPHAYWRVWTDQIVHRIHLRVLRHVRRVAEAEQA